MDTNRLNRTVASNVQDAMDAAVPKQNLLSMERGTGISQADLQLRLAGTSDWTISEMARVASHLGTTPADLFKVAALVILTPEEVKDKLSLVTVQTLYNWRSLSRGGTQIGPRSFKLGRLVRYYESDVDAWLEGLRAQSSAS